MLQHVFLQYFFTHTQIVITLKKMLLKLSTLTRSMLDPSSCVSFSHVRRSGNKIAHNLARHSKNVRGLSVWVEDVPPHLVDVLFAEPG